MRLFLAVFAAVLLSGCASTGSSPSQFYRPATGGEQISISGSLTQTRGFMYVPSNSVSILFNGQRVMGGEFGYGSAEFSGNYSGKPVNASCSSVDSGSLILFSGGRNRIDVNCLVFVAGERAANLVLVPN